MKRVLYTILVSITLLCLNAEASYGQKLVIGSKVDLSKVEGSLIWLNEKPAEGKKYIVDFFSVKNPSSMSFYEQHIDRVAKELGSDYEIILVNMSDSEELQQLIAKDGDKYHFAVDADGKLFKLFDVKFLPFTVALDSKKLLWQGNLSTLETDKL